MLLRKVGEEFRTQNWVALILDLIVVVVGIVLAFQVDRWYEQRLFEAREDNHLQDLAEDFSLSEAIYEEELRLMSETTEATVALLEARLQDPIRISNPEFYAQLRVALRRSDFEPVRRTYDAIISTGEIGTIRDETLRQALAQFFGRSSLRSNILENRRRQQVFVVDPWIVKNFDYVALMQANHPVTSDTSRMQSMHEPNQFHSAIRGPVFESMMATTWHSDYEVVRVCQRELELIREIKGLIADSLTDQVDRQ